MAEKTELVEVKAGIHIDLVQAKVSGVKLAGGKFQLLGLSCDFGDFHGDMEALEDLGADGFEATVTIEGRILREKIPSGQKVPEGQQQLVIPDRDEDAAE